MYTSERQKIETRFSIKAEMRIMRRGVEMEMQSKMRPGMRIGSR